MANSTKTKIFTSEMAGAPVLSGTAGALAALLDAVLVTGFGAGGVTSLVVSAGVATATYASGHPFVTNAVAIFAGATPAALNGEKRVTGTGANWVKFLAPGVPDGAATGAVTSKAAPLGWAKPFAGANKGGYKPADPMATGCVLRLDDTGTTNARVVGYESMVDVDTGLGAFPRAEQIAGGGFWNKSATADATARPWVIVGDGRSFYLCTSSGGVPYQSTVWFFGDLVTTKSGDAYGCVLHSSSTDVSNLGGAVACMGFSQKAATAAYLPRAANGLGSAVGSVRQGSMHYGINDSYSGYGNYAPTLSYPNAADNGLIMCKVVAIDSQSLRGVFPGLLHVPQANAQDAFPSKTFVQGAGDFYGHTLMAIRVGGPSSLAAGAYGAVFFDISDDWR